MVVTGTLCQSVLFPGASFPHTCAATEHVHSIGTCNQGTLDIPAAYPEDIRRYIPIPRWNVPGQWLAEGSSGDKTRPLHWRHNEYVGVSNYEAHGCLFNRLLRRRSKKISKLRVTGLCAGNSPGTGEFPIQMASHAENVSIWWRHHFPSRTYGQLSRRHICLGW